jgi:hypothetical protein
MKTSSRREGVGRGARANAGTRMMTSVDSTDCKYAVGSYHTSTPKGTLPEQV